VDLKTLGTGPLFLDFLLDFYRPHSVSDVLPATNTPGSRIPTGHHIILLRLQWPLQYTCGITRQPLDCPRRAYT